jgi:biopolymer transport protein ExbD
MKVSLGEEEDIAVQMAPLIDCVFLLLIFFLVATSLKKIEKELPLDPPVSAASVARPADDNMTIISLDREGNLFLGAEPVGQGYLQRKLREVAGQSPEHRVRIDGDRNTPMHALVQVLDLCHFEGIDNVGIKTKKSIQGHRR